MDDKEAARGNKKITPDRLADQWAALLDKFKHLGHVPIIDEFGDVDKFVMDAGYHNGPGCSVCRTSYCQHCESVETLETAVGQCIGPDGVAKQKAEWHRKRIEAAVDLLKSEGYTVEPPR